MSDHVQDRLSAYVDGALGAPEQAVVQEHLRACGSCTRRLAELGAVDEAMRAIPVDAPPGYFDTFANRVRGRLEREKRPPRTLPPWTLALAALLLLAVVTSRLIEKAQPAGSDRADAPTDPLPGAPSKLARAEATPTPAPPATVLNAPTAVPPPAARRVPPATPLSGRGVLDKTNPSPEQEAAPGFAVPAPALAEAPRPTAPPAGPDTAARGEEEQKVQAPTPQAWVRGPRVQGQAAGRAASPPPESERDGARQTAEGVAQGANEAAADAGKDSGSPGASRARPAQARERRAERSHKADAVAAPASDPETDYGRLRARSAQSVSDSRALREAWRTFSLRYPDSAHADEARVRVIEASAQAFQLGRDPADRELFERDAAGYLAREDAAQKARVRALLDPSQP